MPGVHRFLNVWKLHIRAAKMARRIVRFTAEPRNTQLPQSHSMIPFSRFTPAAASWIPWSTWEKDSIRVKFFHGLVGKDFHFFLIPRRWWYWARVSFSSLFSPSDRCNSLQNFHFFFLVRGIENRNEMMSSLFFVRHGNPLKIPLFLFLTFCEKEKLKVSQIRFYSPIEELL